MNLRGCDKQKGIDPGLGEIMRNTTRALVLLVIIGVLASCGAKKEEEPQLAENGMVMAPYLTDFEQAQQQAAESNKKILIDFYADW